MNNILSGILPTGYNVSPDLRIAGSTPFAFGGLNLVYAPDSMGKSFQTAALAGSETDDDQIVIYLDADGSQGKLFVDHCKSHNVEYVNMDNLRSSANDSMLDLISSTVRTMLSHASMVDKDVVVILDSLSAIFEGMRINNSEDISPAMYELNGLAAEYNAALILIDHATKTEHGFKLEGNESGKKRATVTTCRYQATDAMKPELGGVFEVERSRGGLLSKGQKFSVGPKKTLSDAIDVIVDRFDYIVDENGISSNMLTAKAFSDKVFKPLKKKYPWFSEFADDAKLSTCDPINEGKIINWKLKTGLSRFSSFAEVLAKSEPVNNSDEEYDAKLAEVEAL